MECVIFFYRTIFVYKNFVNFYRLAFTRIRVLVVTRITVIPMEQYRKYRKRWWQHGTAMCIGIRIDYRRWRQRQRENQYHISPAFLLFSTWNFPRSTHSYDFPVVHNSAQIYVPFCEQVFISSSDYDVVPLVRISPIVFSSQGGILFVASTVSAIRLVHHSWLGQDLFVSI